MGQDLASISSLEEKNAIRALHDNVWVGINDKASEGTFVNVDGSPILAQNLWHPGQPNNLGGNQDCAHLMSNSLLNDLSCSTSSLYFVCETPRSSTTGCGQCPEGSVAKAGLDV